MGTSGTGPFHNDTAADFPAIWMMLPPWPSAKISSAEF